MIPPPVEFAHRRPAALARVGLSLPGVNLSLKGQTVPFYVVLGYFSKKSPDSERKGGRNEEVDMEKEDHSSLP